MSNVSYIPPFDFTELPDEEEGGTGSPVKAVAPLVCVDNTVSIASASSTSAGAVSQYTQRFCGDKYFDSIPHTEGAPTLSDHLVNKGYVDDKFVDGITWDAPVKMFHDFNTVPAGVIAGDRLVAISTVAPSISANYIYTLMSDGAWEEQTPIVGLTVKCVGGTVHADESITYTAAGAWVNNGVSLLHQSLVGSGARTHAEIDTALANLGAEQTTLRSLKLTDDTEAYAKGMGALFVTGGVSVYGKTFLADIAADAIRTESHTESQYWSLVNPYGGWFYQIAVREAIESKIIRCSTAPARSTDVVRLADLPSVTPVINVDLALVLDPAGCCTGTITGKLTKNGNTVTVCLDSLSTFTTKLNMMLTTTLLPYLPTTFLILPYVVSVGGNMVIGTIRVNNLSGKVAMYNVNETGFPASNSLSVYGFCFSYVTAS